MSNLSSRVCWRNCAKTSRANCARPTVNRGLLWLTLADLPQAWLRAGLAALAIAAAILAVALFAGQIKLHQSEVLASYEAAGAATFVVQLTGVADDEIDALAGSVRTISDVRSAEAPYSGMSENIVADTSFLVFRNEQQQEYLGARTSVLGVGLRSSGKPSRPHQPLMKSKPR